MAWYRGVHVSAKQAKSHRRAIAGPSLCAKRVPNKPHACACHMRATRVPDARRTRAKNIQKAIAGPSPGHRRAVAGPSLRPNACRTRTGNVRPVPHISRTMQNSAKEHVFDRGRNTLPKNNIAGPLLATNIVDFHLQSRCRQSCAGHRIAPVPPSILWKTCEQYRI